MRILGITFSLQQIQAAIRSTLANFSHKDLEPAFQNLMLELHLRHKQDEKQELLELAGYLKVKRSMDEVIKHLHFDIPPNEKWFTRLEEAGYKIEITVTPERGLLFKIEK